MVPPAPGPSPAPAPFGGHSMVAPLRRVLVCAPDAAGWSDPFRAASFRTLGYPDAPAAAAAGAAHRRLVEILEAAGAEVEFLAPAAELTLDAVFVHDASFVTDGGAVVLRMGKAARRGEPERHAGHYRARDLPILGRIREPGTVEAGDLVWLDRRRLLCGRGQRTNAAGLAQLRALLEPLAVEVIEAQLPYGDGPAACLHLQSLVSPLDERTALVDLPWLPVPAVEALEAAGYERVEIDPDERATLACNVLALGGRKLVALDENVATHDRLRERGFEVLTVPGNELAAKGGGGPTCLTRALWRAP